MAAGAVPDATYGGDQDNTSAWFTFWFQLIWFTMVYYGLTMVYYWFTLVCYEFTMV